MDDSEKDISNNLKNISEKELIKNLERLNFSIKSLMAA